MSWKRSSCDRWTASWSHRSLLRPSYSPALPRSDVGRLIKQLSVSGLVAQLACKVIWVSAGLQGEPVEWVRRPRETVHTNRVIYQGDCTSQTKRPSHWGCRGDAETWRPFRLRWVFDQENEEICSRIRWFFTLVWKGWFQKHVSTAPSETALLCGVIMIGVTEVCNRAAALVLNPSHWCTQTSDQTRLSARPWAHIHSQWSPLVKTTDLEPQRLNDTQSLVKSSKISVISNVIKEKKGWLIINVTNLKYRRFLKTKMCRKPINIEIWI